MDQCNDVRYQSINKSSLEIEIDCWEVGYLELKPSVHKVQSYFAQRCWHVRLTILGMAALSHLGGNAKMSGMGLTYLAKAG